MGIGMIFGDIHDKLITDHSNVPSPVGVYNHNNRLRDLNAKKKIKLLNMILARRIRSKNEYSDTFSRKPRNLIHYKILSL